MCWWCSLRLALRLGHLRWSVASEKSHHRLVMRDGSLSLVVTQECWYPGSRVVGKHLLSKPIAWTVEFKVSRFSSMVNRSVWRPWPIASGQSTEECQRCWIRVLRLNAMPVTPAYLMSSSSAYFWPDVGYLVCQVCICKNDSIGKGCACCGCCFSCALFAVMSVVHVCYLSSSSPLSFLLYNAVTITDGIVS